MSFLLVRDRLTDRGRQIGIAAAFSKDRLDIRLFNTEQAVSYFSVGRQPKSVTTHAERLADRSNESDASLSVFKHKVSRWSPRILYGARYEWHDLVRQSFDDFMSKQDLLSFPGFVGIQWHEFDESDFDAGLAGKVTELEQFPLQSFPELIRH